MAEHEVSEAKSNPVTRTGSDRDQEVVAFEVVRSPKAAVNHALVCSATAALQAQERLFLDFKESDETLPLVPDMTGILDKMKSIKSQLEDTTVDLPRPVLEENAMLKLKTLMLMHMPRTMTEEIRSRFSTLIEEAMQDTGCFLLYAALSYCPWYASTQPELGQQAKHSTVIVVFTNPDTYTFSPSNRHSKEQTEVIDEGWFYAMEAKHFAKYLVKGKSRIVESLFAGPRAVLLTTPEWENLLATVDKAEILRLKPFLEQCRGQAVFNVAKKSKKSQKLKLKDTASLYDFCESFRLLHNAMQALTTQTLDVTTLHVDQLGETSKNAHSLITTMYTHESNGRTKEDLFDLLLVAKGEVDALMNGVKPTPAKGIEQCIGQWLFNLRAGDRSPCAQPGLLVSDRANLEALMQEVGGPVAKMDPENIVVVVRAGSFLYDLHTPESDVDYLVVYVEPTQNLLSSVWGISESKENRGPSMLLEYGAYEARLFAEMLLKGSIIIAEIVFVGEAEYASASWKALCAQFPLFVTEHLILQYLGLISNNMHLIKNDKYKGNPREKKLFYQIFHKLWSVESMLEGRAPSVRCTGPVKDFIMSIRHGPLEGDLDRDALYKRAYEQLQSLRRALANRATRLPEHADMGYLTDWLMTLRGWSNPSTQ